jgi:ubiquinone/menaquinone biosynthesis C-methylase UbiE
MSSPPSSSWGSSYRLIASEKWKAKSAAMGRDVTSALVEYAQPRQGMNILDLASGTGEPAISLASLVGPAGHVTALDLSADLLKIAEQRAQERGLKNLSVHEADANQLPFPDESFDLVTSRFGVMFFKDEALSECRRVLKSGARACFLAWGPPEQPYWGSTMGVVTRHLGKSLLQPKGPDPFKYGQPGSLSQVLKKAGFREIHEETKTVPWTWPGTPEEVWEQCKSVATPFLSALESIPAGQWQEIDADVLKKIRRYVHGDRIEFGASVVLASGTR